MKKAIVLFVLVLAVSVFAQNLQVHYDVKDDRQYLTTTLEMFKPDAMGSTFWFVDMDYNSNEQNKTCSLAYWELARYFSTPLLDGKLSATVQYNDGVIIGAAGDAYWGAPLHSVWLGGLSYFIPGCKGNISVDVLYRHMDISEGADAQLTLVWFYPFFDGKLQFTGFFDYWTQDDYAGDKQGVMLTEPQLWYVLNKTFSVGGEVEISNNFLPGLDDVQVFPTLGVKWNF